MSCQRSLLRVDLTAGQISREVMPEKLRRRFLGGEGINSWLLWEHFRRVDPHIDPLAPENVLILGAGALAGTSLGTGSKMKFTYKSPAYHIFGDTTVGGHLASQLRWSGVEHIVFTGKADHPVYLLVRDDEVQLRDARRLVGMTTSETDAAIKQELGEADVSIGCVGPAAENFVRFASVIVDRHRAGGRTGGGCIMASKNLKAVVAHGTKGLPIHDPRALLAAAEELFQRNKDLPKYQKFMRFGTLWMTRYGHRSGTNTYRNGQGGEMPDDRFVNLDPYWYRDNLGRRSIACSPGCIFGCGHWHQVKGNETPAAPAFAGQWSPAPEYGAANPFGASCDCPDLVAVSHFTRLCNEYGMDVMEVGMTISFLMELWQRGIIGKQDVLQWSDDDDLSLEWGDQQAMEKLIHAIAFQTNELGRILAVGVYRAALDVSRRKGTDVVKYACYGKGGSTHEGAVRSAAAMSMACALASIGAHHLKGFGVDPSTSVAHFGRPDAGDYFSTVLKGKGHALAETLTAIANSLGACTRFGVGQTDFPLDLIARALEAATGLGLSADDLLAAGERLVNIQKAFNSRLGLTRADDTLCHRWLNEPQLDGMHKGARAGTFLEAAKDEYYEARGWDVRTGLQRRAKLAELDLHDVADVLDGEGVLATEGAACA